MPVPFLLGYYLKSTRVNHLLLPHSIHSLSYKYFLYYKDSLKLLLPELSSFLLVFLSSLSLFRILLVTFIAAIHPIFSKHFRRSESNIRKQSSSYLWISNSLTSQPNIENHSTTSTCLSYQSKPTQHTSKCAVSRSRFSLSQNHNNTITTYNTRKLSETHFCSSGLNKITASSPSPRWVG